MPVEPWCSWVVDVVVGQLHAEGLGVGSGVGGQPVAGSAQRRREASTARPRCPAMRCGHKRPSACAGRGPEESRPAGPEQQDPGSVLDRAAVPIAAAHDVGEAGPAQLRREIFSAAEEQHAGVDPVLAVRKHVVGVEDHATAVDVGDLEPLPQTPNRYFAFAVRACWQRGWQVA
jgi:hypothetical protein